MIDMRVCLCMCSVQHWLDKCEELTYYDDDYSFMLSPVSTLILILTKVMIMISCNVVLFFYGHLFDAIVPLIR